MTEPTGDHDPLESLRKLSEGGPNYDAMALSWVMSVAAQVELDVHPDIISAGGADAVKDLRDIDRYRYGEESLADELQERCRQEELASGIREVTSRDPGVLEKNTLLASWADIFDDVRIFERNGIDPESDHAKTARSYVQRLTTHYLDLFVHLQKQIEVTAPDMRNLMVQQQFLGLWAVYKTGQSVRSSP